MFRINHKICTSAMLQIVPTTMYIYGNEISYLLFKLLAALLIFSLDTSHGDSQTSIFVGDLILLLIIIFSCIISTMGASRGNVACFQVGIDHQD